MLYDYVSKIITSYEHHESQSQIYNIISNKAHLSLVIDLEISVQVPRNKQESSQSIYSLEILACHSVLGKTIYPSTD